MLKQIILGTLLIALFGCANSADQVPMSQSYEKSGNLAQESSDQNVGNSETQLSDKITEKDVDVSPRVLLRQADCQYEVEEIQAKVKQMEALCESYGGYLAHLNWENQVWRKSATITIRVPARAFSPLLDSLATFAIKVDHQRINTQDVTEEYVDIQTRLKAKKEVRDRYVEILRSRAKTVEEILLAEEKIRRLQEEIEAQEGRLRYLEDHAALSIITMRLYEDIEEEPIAEADWWTEFKEEAGVQFISGASFLENLFLGLLGIWPLLIVFGVLFWKRKDLLGKFRNIRSEA